MFNDQGPFFYVARTLRYISNRVLVKRNCNGKAIPFEDTETTCITPDGGINTLKESESWILVCGHRISSVSEISGTCALCESYDEKSGDYSFECKECLVTCPICGRSICLRCSTVYLDNNRYCYECIALLEKREFNNKIKGFVSIVLWSLASPFVEEKEE